MFVGACGVVGSLAFSLFMRFCASSLSGTKVAAFVWKYFVIIPCDVSFRLHQSLLAVGREKVREIRYQLKSRKSPNIYIYIYTSVK